jgi:hypothetical protein
MFDFINWDLLKNLKKNENIVISFPQPEPPQNYSNLIMSQRIIKDEYENIQILIRTRDSYYITPNINGLKEINKEQYEQYKNGEI